MLKKLIFSMKYWVKINSTALNKVTNKLVDTDLSRNYCEFNTLNVSCEEIIPQRRREPFIVICSEINPSFNTLEE